MLVYMLVHGTTSNLVHVIQEAMQNIGMYSVCPVSTKIILFVRCQMIN